MLTKIQIIHFEDVTDIEAVETVSKLLNFHESLNDGDGYYFDDIDIGIEYAEVNTYGEKSPSYLVYRKKK